jgi:hypothetical protein
VEHLKAVLVAAGTFAFSTKDLSRLTPVPARIVVQIRAAEDVAAKHPAMAFLHVFIRLPATGSASESSKKWKGRKL